MNTRFSMSILMFVICIAVLVLVPAELSRLIVYAIAGWQVGKWIAEIQSKIDGHGKAD